MEKKRGCRGKAAVKRKKPVQGYMVDEEERTVWSGWDAVCVRCPCMRTAS
jgi:hypothetical protein